MTRVRFSFGVAAMVLTAIAALPTPAFADSTREKQWFLDYLNVAAAQKVSTGIGITVAVIDDGVAGDHPDLSGSVLPGTDLLSGGSGQQAIDWHGSSMACLIAGHGHGQGRTAGALGIAPGAKILPVKIGVNGSDMSPDRAGNGVDWAVQHGAKVISLSIGGPQGSAQEKAAIDRAVAADVVVVAAVGDRPADQAVDFPAAYPGVLAVGATDETGKVADVSVTGPQMVLSAPGAHITSCNNVGGYITGSGSSASTAIVAGAAALIRSKYPSMSAAEVVHRLTATAKDAGAPGRDDQYGYGILNLVGALTANVPPLTATAGPTQATATGPQNSNAPTPDMTTTPQATGSSKGTVIGIGVAVAAVAILILALVLGAARRKQ